MRRLVLLAAFLLFSVFSFGQCPDGQIILSSQAEVDAFAINYPGCTEVDDLKIEGFDIVNLNGLSQIEAIGTELAITYNFNLTDISGLNDLQFTSEDGRLHISENNNLESLSGLLEETHLEVVNINANANLATLTGLESLTSVDHLRIVGSDLMVDLTGLNGIQTLRKLTINGGDNLSSLNGLHNVLFLHDSEILFQSTYLTSLQGLVADGSNLYSIKLEHNGLLNNLDGLEGISTLNGFIYLEGNYALEEITALSNVVSGTLNTLYLLENPLLTSLEGLEFIDTITGGVVIRDNNSLTNLDGLSISTIGELEDIELSIIGNDVLTDISALNSITDIAQLSKLEIIYNPLLSVCNEEKVCEYLANGGNGYFSANASGCNLVSEVLASCGLCPSGEVTLTTQAEVDAFALNFPDCNRLAGLTIIGDNITYLSPLSSLQGLGFLTIDNTSLINLNGLQNITGIREQLSIKNNSQLANLTGLNNLTSMCGELGSSLSITNNPMLTSITALSNLSGGCFAGIGISNNDSLQSLEGLEGLSTTLGGSVSISGNDALTSLIGLSGLVNVDYGISITNNINLVAINGLDNLNSAPDRIIIEGNSALESIDLEVSTNLWRIENNANLISISGISGLHDASHIDLINNPQLTEISIAPSTELFYNFHIEDNDMLTDLNLLSNIAIIQGLTILDNDQLTSFNGLQGTEFLKFDTPLIIEGNDLLADISAMEALNLAAIPELQIKNNPLLSYCNVESICNYLDNDGDAIIEFNADECNSREEVETACNSLSVSENSLNELISIYPNPASEALFIKSSEELSVEKIMLYTVLGNRIQTTSEAKLDVSKLSAGIYLVEIITDHGELIKKVVKQ